MNELIKEVENLYNHIDNVQLHLVNSRLNNDEEGNKSAISEMETAMCDVMQLLKCFIDRNDKEQNTDNATTATTRNDMQPAYSNQQPQAIHKDNDLPF